MTEQERFWSKVDVAIWTGPCWEWLATVNNEGYGNFRAADGKLVKAHRFAYEQVNGKIEDGKQIDHLCRNHSCVNPSHLEAVTQTENMARGIAWEFNRKKTHCYKGHEYTADNTYIWTKRGSTERICKSCSREYQERKRRERGVPIRGPYKSAT